MFRIVSELDQRHTATTQFPLDDIAVANRLLQLGQCQVIPLCSTLHLLCVPDESGKVSQNTCKNRGVSFTKRVPGAEREETPPGVHVHVTPLRSASSWQSDREAWNDAPAPLSPSQSQVPSDGPVAPPAPQTAVTNGRLRTTNRRRSRSWKRCATLIRTSAGRDRTWPATAGLWGSKPQCTDWPSLPPGRFSKSD